MQVDNWINYAINIIYSFGFKFTPFCNLSCLFHIAFSFFLLEYLYLQKNLILLFKTFFSIVLVITPERIACVLNL